MKNLRKKPFVFPPMEKPNDTYFYLRDQELWGFESPTDLPLRVIDFEDDIWRHDIHFVPPEGHHPIKYYDNLHGSPIPECG